MSSAITYLGCGVALAVLVQLMGAQAGGVSNTYLIKSREISDTAEALSILRRFMPSKLKPDERCEKYAVMLSFITKSRLDQFKLAEIGLAQPERIRQKYSEIDVETLRQLYFDGIDEFRTKHVDSSLLELVDCLNQKFKTLDAKARKFLNDPELKEILLQYKSITSLPLTFLTDLEHKHPSLTYDKLMPSIKKTLLDLFNGDESKLKLKFLGADHQVAEESVLDDASVSSGEAAPAVIDEVIPEQETTTTTSTTITTPMPVPTGSGDDLADVHQHPSEVLSQEENTYLKQIIASLHKLYDELPLESKLNDRCMAYSKVIESEAPSEELTKEVLQETLKRVATSGPMETVFMPSKEGRENFLFTLISFGKEDIGHGTWVDLVDCVSQWEKDDPEIEKFMNSPEQAKIFEDLLKASENEAANNLPAATASASASASVHG